MMPDAMPQPEPQPPPPPQQLDPRPARDQQVLLIIMGVLIGIFALCGLGNSAQTLSGLAHLPTITGEIQAELEKEGVPDADIWVARGKSLFMRGIWAQFLLQLLGCAAYFWLAVGSILPRRWGPRILYALGWMWIGSIVLSTVAMLGAIPAVSEVMAATGVGSMIPGLAGPVQGLIVVGVFVVVMLMQAVPGIVLIVVYGLRDVRLTVNFRDPIPRWSDPIPIPVLILWTALVSGAIYLAAIGLSLGSVIWQPLGIGGIAGIGLGLAVAAILGATAWLVVKLRPAGWWLAMCGAVFATFFGVFVILSFDFWQTVDRLELPEQVMTKFRDSIPEEGEIAIEALNRLWLPVVIFGSGLIGYIAWLKKFFTPDHVSFSLR